MVILRFKSHDAQADGSERGQLARWNADSLSAACRVRGQAARGPAGKLPALQSVSGFTLVELLVVVTIIGILAGLALVNVRHAQRKAAENALRYNLFQMRKAIDDFYADKQRFPGSLQELVEAKYMRKIPLDPITRSADSWIEVHEEPDPNQPFSVTEEVAGPGVVDVKSGAEGQTMDEPPIPYSEL
jgi:general secretion pathway protein G